MVLSRRNPLVRFFSSIWVGLALMGLILIYACVASALPQVRGALEMTEMQIFRHWVFTLLISLFTVTLLTATIVRIPFRMVNAGVLTVHTGLLLLVGGSLWYFSTKVEGDVLLLSPRVQLVSTGSGGERVVAEFLADAGQSWSSVMPAFGGETKLDVVDVGRDADGIVNYARVQARLGDGSVTVHDVSSRDSDIPIFKDRLSLRLETFPAASQFFDNETPALYVRRSDKTALKVVPIHGLPLFRERYLGGDEEIHDAAQLPVPSKRTSPGIDLAGLKIPTGIFEDWRLPVRLDSAELPFDVEVTGFLPYVSRFEQKAVNGTSPNPAVNLRLSAGKLSRRISLFALDPAKSMVSVGLPIEFRWVENEAERDSAVASTSGPFELDVTVIDPPVHKTYSVRRGEVIRVEGTPYELTVKDLMPSWPLMTAGFSGAVSPMASVDVTNGKLTYNRTVIQRFPNLSQDIDEGGTRHRDGPYDPNLVLRYRTTADGWMSVVAGPDIEPVAAVFDSSGKSRVYKLAAGETRPILFDNMPIDLTLEQFLPSGRAALVPLVEPLETRRPNIAMRSMSAVRLVFTGRGENAGWSETQWCIFSQYPSVEERPIQVSMPGDSSPWEVVYSRFARDLGVALAPGKLAVKFFPGRENVESWRSDFGVIQADGTVEPGSVFTNETFRAGPWTLFQSGAAGDHWSYTIVGVGNREGIWPMLLGCVFITIGCLFAFYVKPILLRRRAGQAGMRQTGAGQQKSAPVTQPCEVPEPRVAARSAVHGGNGQALAASGSAVKLGLAIAIGLASASTLMAGDQPFDASRKAAELDVTMDWSQARLIAVQDAGRYKTLDSFARESMTAMYGHESLPGLSPMASMFEWLFNREAYADLPVIRIKDKGVRIHLSTQLPEAARRRVQDTGYMTPHELADDVVESRVRELEPMAPMVSAMRRVRDAQVVARALEKLIRVVPSPGGSVDAEWFTPKDLIENLPIEERSRMAAMSGGMSGGAAVPGVSADQATAILGMWASLWKGWKTGDAALAQDAMDRLADALPSLAAQGVYPSSAQREAEASYYAWGKFTWGMWIYLFGAVLAVPALVTGWRGPWLAAIALLVVAIVVHGFGISLRWYILGRIPVANMFEAVVGSAWIGVVLGLLAELRYKTRVFLLAASVTGFFALTLGGFVIPGGGTLTTIMGILDDLMLRIHTVLIISSYSLIFLASVIAIVYLFGYYHRIDAVKSSHVGFIIAAAGAIVWGAMGQVFEIGPDHAAGMLKRSFAAPAFGSATAALVLLLVFMGRRVGAAGLAWLVCLAIACCTLYLGDYSFSRGAALTLLCVGLSWAGLNRLGSAMRFMPAGINNAFVPAVAGVGPMAQMAAPALSLRSQRPLLAGGAPGDEGRGTKDMPLWLHRADWSQLIILNMVFVMLFVGIILGAVWADYSWGRPWGWDPKEVFALNTLIIYAMLIHVRFVVKDRGLWTAWLSVAGCLMMAFNWCFVNFYIVGLHSYA